MTNPSNDKNLSDTTLDNEQKISLEGYPTFPPKDDIYNKLEEEGFVDTDGVIQDNQDKGTLENPNEFGFQDIISDNDLDIPGSELDNKQEEIGSEDEENNYYSIGGDNHDNLEEDKEN